MSMIPTPMNSLRSACSTSTQCTICKPYEFLEINGNRPLDGQRSVTLCREKPSSDQFQVTYKSTDCIRFNAHGVHFEIVVDDIVIALEDCRKTDVGQETNMRTGYIVRLGLCYAINEFLTDRKPATDPEPSIEVYFAVWIGFPGGSDRYYIPKYLLFFFLSKYIIH
ncbi:hypothetical protein CRG98_018942 [Punica granatum]|uniref:Uncharacterized protein n=1 Tax=Punica granatum TaxID=22663 RepID=A0A2I0JWP5_PUNGR|nr:hypothetical protein CRG98_018942 [Punica granatum]